MAPEDVGAVRCVFRDLVRRPGEGREVVRVGGFGVGREDRRRPGRAVGEHLRRRGFVVKSDVVQIHQCILGRVVEREEQKAQASDVPAARLVELRRVVPNRLLIVRAGDRELVPGTDDAGKTGRVLACADVGVVPDKERSVIARDMVELEETAPVGGIWAVERQHDRPVLGETGVGDGERAPSRHGDNARSRAQDGPVADE